MPKKRCGQGLSPPEANRPPAHSSPPEEERAGKLKKYILGTLDSGLRRAGSRDEENLRHTGV